MLRAYTWMQVHVGARLRREDGGVAAEYAILIAAIALVVVGGAVALGIAINARLNEAAVAPGVGTPAGG